MSKYSKTIFTCSQIYNFDLFFITVCYVQQQLLIYSNCYKVSNQLYLARDPLSYVFEFMLK